jgi:hypothetical protein
LDEQLVVLSDELKVLADSTHPQKVDPKRRKTEKTGRNSDEDTLCDQ